MLLVQEETPRQPEVARLLQQSDALAALLYPGEYRRPLNPETLVGPGIQVFVARKDSAAVGCCALFKYGEAKAELKRMIVDEDFRHQGVATALLQAVEKAAGETGIKQILLEVGIRNTSGYALYVRSGYKERGPFGSYKPSPISRFLEKSLEPQQATAA
jgi:putative acetyltransferase